MMIVLFVPHFLLPVVTPWVNASVVEALPRISDMPLWTVLVLGPTGGLTIALVGCWIFLRRFERLQDELLAFFRQELQDAHSRYARLVELWLNRLRR